ncbi:hypothetical protein AXG93_2573s1030 [Marchantia polymorpha subsp. ruderalis]|uniref:Uncharacterized protein n=1 Tax=Marchantia polymorpha subsp. ruderalis TaxID=1480154 RepID=A0A176WGS8_MARPO|nr:hypothetical protein AXG93_2573s1030 [Marchantia polymorpha subsp. ruderalis]
MSDDGWNQYSSNYGDIDSKEDYGGEYEKLVAHLEYLELSHKVITKESLLVAQGEDLRKPFDPLGPTGLIYLPFTIYHLPLPWNVESLFGRLVDKGMDDSMSGVRCLAVSQIRRIPEISWFLVEFRKFLHNRVDIEATIDDVLRVSVMPLSTTLHLGRVIS